MTFALGRGRPPLVYVPYLARIETIKRPRYRLHYNGGDVEVDLKATDGVLFYGMPAESCVPLAFLDDAARYNVTITFHRTHLAEPLVLARAALTGRRDLLTAQIHAREDGRQRAYVARMLVAAHIETQGWLTPASTSFMKRVRAARTVDAVRTLEAIHTKRYWDAYFSALALGDTTRREDSSVARAIDAANMLVRGVLLRWIIFHRLSPAHGFLHVTTDFNALVFDLVEPYRPIVERVVFKAYQEHGDSLSPDHAVAGVKAALAEVVYVPATRQYVPAKGLLHGIVLALRSYLSGDMQRFVIPIQGKPQSGRPLRVTYSIPGAIRQ